MQYSQRAFQCMSPRWKGLYAPTYPSCVYPKSAYKTPPTFLSVAAFAGAARKRGYVRFRTALSLLLQHGYTFFRC